MFLNIAGTKYKSTSLGFNQPNKTTFSVEIPSKIAVFVSLSGMSQTTLRTISAIAPNKTCVSISCRIAPISNRSISISVNEFSTS